MTAKGPVPAVSGTQGTPVATPDLIVWSIDPLNMYLGVDARSRANAEGRGIRVGGAIAPASSGEWEERWQK